MTFLYQSYDAAITGYKPYGQLPVVISLHHPFLTVFLVLQAEGSITGFPGEKHTTET